MIVTFLPIIGCRQHGEVYFQLNITRSPLNRLEYKSSTKWALLNESEVHQPQLGALRHHSLGSISAGGHRPYSLCGRQAAQACVKYLEAS